MATDSHRDIVKQANSSHPESAYWLALIYSPDIRLERVKSVVADWCLHAGKPLSAMFSASANQLSALGLTAVEQAALAKARQDVDGQALRLGRYLDEGIQVITRSDSRYPQSSLGSLPETTQPLLLYCRGNVDLLQRVLLGIVGGGQDNPELEDSYRDLGRLLAEEDVTVVTGLSKGAPKAVQDGALESQTGTSIAVLPMGLAALSLSQGLQAELDSGKTLLISPFPPEAGFTAERADARNRLLAAMGDGLLMVDLDGQSTHSQLAAEALGLGKMVYIWSNLVAGQPDSAVQQSLIEAGGLPVSDLSDMMDMLDAVVSGAIDRRAQTIVVTGKQEPTPTRENEVEDAFDPAATLDLLSKSGKVPEALARRFRSSQTGKD